MFQLFEGHSDCHQATVRTHHLQLRLRFLPLGHKVLHSNHTDRAYMPHVDGKCHSCWSQQTQWLQPLVPRWFRIQDSGIKGGPVHTLAIYGHMLRVSHDPADAEAEADAAAAPAAAAAVATATPPCVPLFPAVLTLVREGI